MKLDIPAAWQYDPFNTQETHAQIQGKMVVVTESYDERQILLTSKDEIKRHIALNLVHEMMKNGSIEFTQQKDHQHMEVVIRARCFVVPNAQVQILREKGY